MNNMIVEDQIHLILWLMINLAITIKKTKELTW